MGKMEKGRKEDGGGDEKNGKGEGSGMMLEEERRKGVKVYWEGKNHWEGKIR